MAVARKSLVVMVIGEVMAVNMVMLVVMSKRFAVAKEFQDINWVPLSP